MKRVLVMPGGGMCGLPAAKALVALNKLAGGQLLDKVDAATGTSIGGIVTLLFASGEPIEKIPDFFTDDGPQIFDKTFWDIGISGSIYSRTAIDQCLIKRFGARTLKDCKIPVLITGMDACTQEPFLTKTYDPSNLNDGLATQLNMVAGWTSAAEHYFPAYEYFDKLLWDGGNIANNPADCLNTDLPLLWDKSEPVKWLVLGTGAAKALTPEQVRNPNAITLLKIIVNMLMNAASEDVDYKMDKIYGSNYRVIQPVFSSPVELDDASAKGLELLSAAGDSMVAAHQSDFEWFLAD